MTIHDDETSIDVPHLPDGSIDYERLTVGMNEGQLRTLVHALAADNKALRRSAAVVLALGDYLDARDKLEAWKKTHPGERAPDEMVRAYVGASARFQEVRRAPAG